MATKKAAPKKAAQRHTTWVVGEKYFVRTVTYHMIGELVAFDEHELWFTKAAWVADSGRFTQAVSNGTLNEVEPYPPEEVVALGRGAIVDACRWLHQLPLKQQ